MDGWNSIKTIQTAQTQWQVQFSASDWLWITGITCQSKQSHTVLMKFKWVIYTPNNFNSFIYQIKQVMVMTEVGHF